MAQRKPLQIHAYATYGTARHLYLLGRALTHRGVDLNDTGLWGAFRNSWKQFMSDEQRNTRLRIEWPQGHSDYVTTNDEGYFKLDQEATSLDQWSNSEGWMNYQVAYDDQSLTAPILGANTFQGKMLIPDANAEYGVISDVDDTILHTGVASFLKWRLIINSLFRHVAQRSPLKGAAALYHQFHRGSSGTKANPIFYVSNSPWNLYHYLDTFLSTNNFPKGPLLLRDFKDPFQKQKAVPEKPHKQKEIRNILKTYPDLKFILIGDSGEHDADIYLEIAQEYPDRILAVYLRSVKHRKRVLRVRSVLESYESVPAILVERSEQARDHALQQGLISRKAILE
ncbi:App1 family protein [Croceiramulus getboli]|nr:DUF2183 domain-containing protein [Flavobacteriaceae bacterium YJPT1-3]